MHLYVMTRGQLDFTNRWANNLTAKYYPYKFDKDKRPGMVQLALRPMQFWEIVFPEPYLDQVLSIVQPYDGGNTKPPDKGGGFSIQGKIMQKVLGMSRIMGLSGTVS